MSSMSPAEVSASSPDKARSIPAWIPAVVVVALLAGGGWGLWTFWNGLKAGGDGVSMTLDEKPSEYRLNSMQDRAQARRRQQDASMATQRQQELTGADFVRERNRTIEAKGGTTRLTAVRANSGKFRLTLAPMDPAFMSDDDRKILLMRNRVATESAMARQVDATPEQVAALNAVPNGLSGTISTVVVYPLDAAARQDLENAISAWDAAAGDAKVAAATALTGKIRSFESSQSGYKAELASRIEKVKSILKPEQIQKFLDMGR